MQVLHRVHRVAHGKAADGHRHVAGLCRLHDHGDELFHGRAGGAVIALRAGQLPVGGVGVLGQVVGADDQKIAPVGHEFLRGQAGRRHAEHDAEGGLIVEGHAPLPQALAAVLHDVHGGVPVLHIGHHGEHHPQRAPGGGAQQGTDLGLKLAGLAQAVADAPQAQLGGLHALIGVRHGAVGAKIEGAHGHRAALCRCKAGRIEVELLLLVQNAAGQHHVAAAQQAHAPGTGLHGGVDVLRAKAAQRLRRPGCSRAGGPAPAFLRSRAAAHRCGLLPAGGPPRPGPGCTRPWWRPGSWFGRRSRPGTPAPPARCRGCSWPGQ